MARIAACVQRYLAIDKKWLRANVCRVVMEVTKRLPDFGLAVLSALVRSLELDDDIYEGVSADGSAVDAISELLVLRWDKAHNGLHSEMARLTTEAHAIAISAYEKLFRRGEDWREATVDGLGEQTAQAAVSYCLEILIDTALETAVGASGCRSCKVSLPRRSCLCADSFDQLLGCLAILVDAAGPPSAGPRIVLPGQEELAATTGNATAAEPKLRLGSIEKRSERDH